MDGLSEQSEQPSFWERFSEIVCSFRTHVYYLFIVEIVLLSLMLFSLLFLESGTVAYAMLQIDFIIFVAALVPTVLILYGCRRRERW